MCLCYIRIQDNTDTRLIMYVFYPLEDTLNTYLYKQIYNLEENHNTTGDCENLCSVL